MKKEALKTYSLDEITDKLIGKLGTPEREEFENELRLDLLEKEIKQANLLTHTGEMSKS
jgi:HTH-type transcriptional regulator/antitoxin HipB